MKMTKLTIDHENYKLYCGEKAYAYKLESSECDRYKLKYGQQSDILPTLMLRIPQGLPNLTIGYFCPRYFYPAPLI